MSTSSLGGTRSASGSQRATLARARVEQRPDRPSLEFRRREASAPPTRAPAANDGRQPRQRDIRETDETRAQELGGAQIRIGRGEIPQQRLQVLHFGRVEEPEPLVDVRPDAARLERVLEILMAGAGAEQDRDVVRPGRARPRPSDRARCALRDQRAISSATAAADVGHRRLGDEAEHRLAVAPRTGPTSRHRKPIARRGTRNARASVVARPACWPASALTNASSSGTARKLVVMACRTCRPGRSAPIRLRGFVEQRHLGVPEPVDGLLAVADDEDRRRRVGGALAFAPGIDQQLDQPPLQPARVLELVHQHVVIARLQLQPAARELLLPLEQRDRPREHAGEIEQRVLVEQPLVPVGGDRQSTRSSPRASSPLTSRVERLERLEDRRRRAPDAPARAAASRPATAKVAAQNRLRRAAAAVPLFVRK